MKKRAYILPFIIIYNLQATSLDNNLPGYSFSEFNIAVDSNNHPHISWVYAGPRTDSPDRTGNNEYEIYYLGFNGASWESAVNVSDNTTYSKFGTFPALVKGQSGEIHLVYNTEAKLEHALWDGSSWSAASVILNEGNQYYYKDIVTGIG